MYLPLPDVPDDDRADPPSAPMRPCFGVACPVRGRCVRYAAVNASEADPSTLLTCLANDAFALFVDRTDPGLLETGARIRPVRLRLVDE